MALAAAPPCFSATSWTLRNEHSTIQRGRRMRVKVCENPPSEESTARTKRKREDTRIHWSNQVDGWIGVNKSPSQDDSTEKKAPPFAGRFADLVNQATTSHYQFMGVGAEADIEEIKAAYRRLSKEYHPDTTTLPLKTASEKFIQLREAYAVLSQEESRKFYDWTLVQEAESKRASLKLADPYQQEVLNAESIPDTVDRLGGKNLELSDQAKTALTFDIAIIIFCCCCLAYVVFFKEPY